MAMAVINRTKVPAVADGATASEDAAPTATADQPTTTAAPARRRRWGRPRTATSAGTAPPSAGARVAAAGAGTALLIARIIRTIAGIVALIIALGIAFAVLNASPSNTIVSHIHSWAHWLAGPFNGMFHLHSARGTIALNWGIALVVYLLIGGLIAGLVAAPARVLRRGPASV